MEPQLGFEVCPSCLDTKSQITTGNWRLYQISQASLGTSQLWLRTRSVRGGLFARRWWTQQDKEVSEALLWLQ